MQRAPTVRSIGLLALLVAGCSESPPPAPTASAPPPKPASSTPRVYVDDEPIDEELLDSPASVAPKPVSADDTPAIVAESQPAPPVPAAKSDAPMPAPVVEKPLTPAEAIAAIEAAGGRVEQKDGVAVAVFLNRTSADDTVLGAVRYLPTIKLLNLSGTKVTDAGLAHVAGLAKLERLYHHNSQVSDDGLRQLKSSLPRVTFLPEKRKLPLAAPVEPVPAEVAPVAAAPSEAAPPANLSGAEPPATPPPANLSGAEPPADAPPATPKEVVPDD